MASLAELIAERESRPEQPQAVSTPDVAATGASLTQLIAERDRRQSASDPRISTSPMKTGVRDIDQAGQKVDKDFVSPLAINAQKTIPSLEGARFDDPRVIRRDRADAGVDMITGLPFIQRLKAAILPNIPELRAKGMERIMGPEFAKIPDDLPKFRYDSSLDEFQFLRPDPENEGIFRWTSLDGAGLEVGDLGDMFNLAEIGSLSLSVLGAGKGKLLTFGKFGEAGQAAVGTSVGGALGRVIGEGASIIINWMQGGELPTRDQLVQAGWEGAQIEAFATVLGESGAYLVRRGSTAAQRKAAQIEGQTAVSGMSPDELLAANKNIRETQEDLIRVENVLGRQDLPVTPGQASHSIDIIEGENFGVKVASKNVQRGFNKAIARGKRTMQDYINAVFGGNKQFLGNGKGIVREVNDALSESGSIVIAQTDDGLIHFVSKLDPENGLAVKSRGGDIWQVAERFEVDQSVQGLGLGQEIYKTAAREAGMRNAVLASDSVVSEEAIEAIWKKLDGSDELGELIWLPKKDVLVEINSDGTKLFMARDGISPIVRMKPRASFTQKLLEEFRGARGVGGRFKKKGEDEFDRFLRNPGKEELAAVVDDIASNPFAHQELKEAIFAHYEASVTKLNKKGKRVFDDAKFTEWKKDTLKVLEKVFEPEEMLFVRRAGGLNMVLKNSRNEVERQAAALSDSLGVPRVAEMLKKDPSQRAIWNQMKARSPRDRVRTMKLLDGMGMGDTLRAHFREDLRHTLLTKTKASNSTGYETWLKDNQQLIFDVLGDTTYYGHLRSIGNILRRRSDKNMVGSSGPDANPTGLGLFRVIFGPLSRMQRFLSAGRKGQVRSGAAKLADLITDPQKLQELVNLRVFDVGSRRVARVVQDLGLLGEFGMDPDRFDVDNEGDRQALANKIALLLQDSFNDEDVE